jgi:acyl carrier protein
MDRGELTERIRQILTTRLGMPPAEVTTEARLVDDLGMDSLDAVELAIAIERQFKVEIGDDQVVKLRTVADIVTLVRQLQEAPSGS